MSVDLKTLVDGLVHAARARPAAPAAGAVSTLQQLVADDLAAINALIVQRIFSEVRIRLPLAGSTRLPALGWPHPRPCPAPHCVRRQAPAPTDHARYSTTMRV